MGDPAPSPSPLACAILLTKDERDTLPDWLAFHGHLLGPENLVVVDNGSADPEVLAELRAAEARGTLVVREPRPFREAAAFMTEHMRALIDRKKPRWLMPLETDEFVFVADDAGRAGGVRPEHLAAALERVPEEVSLLRYAAFWGSSVRPSDAAYGRGGFRYGRPAAEMTRFHDQGWDKLIVRASAFAAMSQWCHHAALRPGAPQVAAVHPALGLLHFHDGGRARSVARAAPVAVSYGLMDDPARGTASELLLQTEAVRGQPVSCGHKAEQYGAHLRRAAALRAFRRYLGRLPSSPQELDAVAARACYRPLPPAPSSSGGCGGHDFLAAIVRRDLAAGTLHRWPPGGQAQAQQQQAQTFATLLFHEPEQPCTWQVTQVAATLRELDQVRSERPPAAAELPAPPRLPTQPQPQPPQPQPPQPQPPRPQQVLVLGDCNGRGRGLIVYPDAASETSGPTRLFVREGEEGGGEGEDASERFSGADIEVVRVPPPSSDEEAEDGQYFHVIVDALRCARRMRYDAVYDARRTPCQEGDAVAQMLRSLVM